VAKDWLTEHGCEFEEADITKDVFQLREWRDLTGGVGVPVIAHGKDFVIGFSAERLEMMLESCQKTNAVEIPEEE
jgi:glutaredoxin